MFDFTKNIILEPTWQKRFLILRAILYLSFIIGLVTLAYVVLLPSLSFEYFFRLSSDSLKNTLISPRNSEQKPLKNGLTEKDGKLFFDASLVGNFSNSSLSFWLEKYSATLQNATLSVRKSYREFFYPTGKPMGFKEGYLLSSNGEYYIISSGTLRRFSSIQTMSSLGFSQNMFTQVSPDELANNEVGENIIDENSFPNGMFIKINNEYYQLQNETLKKFISPRAYLSQFSDNIAVEKNNDFLSKFELSDSYLGFADGTLASVGSGIFILSAGKSYPIDTPETFNAMGLDWQDVVPISSDEFSIYAKQKLNYQYHPHPDGTVFADPSNKEYFLIANQEKHPLIGEHLLEQYLTKKPIQINTQSIKIKDTCTVKKNLFSLNSYTCQIPLENLANFAGNDYQFELSPPSPVHLESLSVKFSTKPTFGNLKRSLSNIKSLMRVHYSSQS